jgi:DNA polymerase I-like protein with 3'-5' exonuclease and polymerase domains
MSFPLFKSLREFYYEYELPLAHAFYNIEQRGVLVDQTKLTKFKEYLDAKLEESCQKIEKEVKLKVVPRQPKGVKTPQGTLNLSSVQQLRKVITGSLHIKLKKDRDSGEESTGEEALNEAFAQTGNQVLKEILSVRELNKIKGTYAEATLVDSVLYSIYHVGGTKTGRRSSTETPFTAESGHKIGSNAQNLPNKTELGKRFYECIVSRPGKIFVHCDQSQAEDWIVSSIIADNGGGSFGLDELKAGIDRHKRLASQLFNKPPEQCTKTCGTIFRYMGKKTRHAANYGMKAPTMAVTLAKEGFSITKDYCELMLRRFHELEPQVRATFQYWVEQQLRDSRTLVTPFGRSRYFFGLRPGADNSKIFKEAYAQIPQSTVGDNTGLAILHCETVRPGWVLMDGHDAVVLEVEDSISEITKAIKLLEESFDREIEFPNGLKIKIPLEFGIGYDLRNEIEINPKCLDTSETGLQHIWDTLRRHQNHR